MVSRIKAFLMPFEGKFSIELFAGLTAALALIPGSIAFAVVAGLDPIVGLFSSFFLCVIAAFVGGRPGMISGAAGAMAVPVISLVANHGVEYLFATMILTGVFQVLVGVFKLGKLIRILPKPVMVGFFNGLAILIFMSQFAQFKMGAEKVWLSGEPLWWMIGLSVIAMAITHFFPKFTKKVPGALVAILAVSIGVYLFGIDTRVVNDMMGGEAVGLSFPSLAWFQIPLNFTSLSIIFPYAITLCVIGLLEALLTLSLIDEITDTRGRANKECVAQGLGNIVSGFFKGMGGCALIGQSMINVRSGGKNRLSSITAAVALLLFIVILWPVIKFIPVAALVGVMFMVVINMFEWATFRYIRKIPLSDALIIVLTTAVTVFADIAIAVASGVIIAALVFAWETAKNIKTDRTLNEDGSCQYTLHGPLFFGSATQFRTLFNFQDDPKEVVIDFAHSRVTDHSAIAAIIFVSERFTSLGKKLHLRHLSPECKVLLGKAGELVETNDKEDPHYHVASNKLG